MVGRCCSEMTGLLAPLRTWREISVCMRERERVSVCVRDRERDRDRKRDE